MNAEKIELQTTSTARTYHAYSYLYNKKEYMAESVRSGRQCVTCKKAKLCGNCLGCNRSFCVDCMQSHRSEISSQLISVIHERDQLCSAYNEPKTIQKHPLFSQIKKWEEESITMIKQAAAEARDKLQQSLLEVKTKSDAPLNELNIALHTAREQADYTEEGNVRSFSSNSNSVKGQLPTIRMYIEGHCMNSMYRYQLLEEKIEKTSRGVR